MTTPVEIFRRVSTTDPSTGEAVDQFRQIGRVLASLEPSPIAELDAAGQVRAGQAWRLTMWRDGLAGYVNVRDRVHIWTKEAVITAEIASITLDGQTMQMEVRAYESL